MNVWINGWKNRQTDTPSGKQAGRQASRADSSQKLMRLSMFFLFTVEVVYPVARIFFVSKG